MYGRKKTFTFGATFLTILTLACAFAKGPLKTIDFVSIIKVSIFFADFTTLAILGGIQGIGGAAMLPAGVTYLFFNFRS